jgi:hypothetical protein
MAAPRSSGSGQSRDVRTSSCAVTYGNLLPDYLRAVVETDDAAPVTGLVDCVWNVEPTREFKSRVTRTGGVGTDGVPLVLLAR